MLEIASYHNSVLSDYLKFSPNSSFPFTALLLVCHSFLSLKKNPQKNNKTKKANIVLYILNSSWGSWYKDSSFLLNYLCIVKLFPPFNYPQ